MNRTFIEYAHENCDDCRALESQARTTAYATGSVTAIIKSDSHDARAHVHPGNFRRRYQVYVTLPGSITSSGTDTTVPLTGPLRYDHAQIVGTALSVNTHIEECDDHDDA